MDLTQIVNEVSSDIIAGKAPVDKPTVLVLVGLQYSGKSYLANHIAEKNYAHFWATNVKKKYGIKNPEMIKVAKQVIGTVANRDFNIVIDFVNHKYETRKQFQNEANALNLKYNVVYIDTPKEVRLERREQNVLQGDLPGRRVISLEQMTEFENNFETPSEDENLVVLRSEYDVNQFLKTL